jgi:hypothetical protein
LRGECEKKDSKNDGEMGEETPKSSISRTGQKGFAMALLDSLF